MLWMSLALPELSLQAHMHGAIGGLREIPLVISDGVPSRPCVHAANTGATLAGVTPGMTLAAAQATVHELVVVSRDAAVETRALTGLADWATQFTPMVCREPDGISLEVSTTLRLFGGVGSLARRLREGAAALGWQATLGIAPTPMAARLLARASHETRGLRMCREPARLRERLASLPLHLFDWPAEIQAPLSTLGLRRIEDLLCQPRPGLQRRFGERVMVDLDRALGVLPDPREPHRLPDTFHGETDLLFEIADAERLAIPIRRLLDLLEGFLRGRGAGVHEIALTLKHNRRFRTTHRFAARQPLRDAKSWMRLIRERLDAHPLPEAVSSLMVDAQRLAPLADQSASWLPTPDMRHEKWQVLAERLTSRLGENAVFMLARHDDHRPEKAWRAIACTTMPPARRTSRRPASNVGASPLPHTPRRPRPTLLLETPEALSEVDGTPQHRGALVLLAGPERIETGWWDGEQVMRDYYVARNPRHEVCWVYTDYRQGWRWFLHGYFA